MFFTTNTQPLAITLYIGLCSDNELQPQEQISLTSPAVGCDHKISTPKSVLYLHIHIPLLNVEEEPCMQAQSIFKDCKSSTLPK